MFYVREVWQFARKYKKMTVTFLVVFNEISWGSKIRKHKGRFYTLGYAKIRPL